jgi:hypothetical protein
MILVIMGVNNSKKPVLVPLHDHRPASILNTGTDTKDTLKLSSLSLDHTHTSSEHRYDHLGIVVPNKPTTSMGTVSELQHDDLHYSAFRFGGTLS